MRIGWPEIAVDAGVLPRLNDIPNVIATHVTVQIDLCYRSKTLPGTGRTDGTRKLMRDYLKIRPYREELAQPH